MPAPIDWLLEGEPYIAYRTRAGPAGAARGRPRRWPPTGAPCWRTPLVRGPSWPSWPAGRARCSPATRAPASAFHSLTFVADLGLRPGDPGMDAIIAAHPGAPVRARGPSSSPPTSARHYRRRRARTPGPGRCATRRSSSTPCCAWAWAATPAVARAVDYLAGLVRPNGWPCAVSQGAGHVGAGPAARTTPAPTPPWPCSRPWCCQPRLARQPGRRDRRRACLLDLWEHSRDAPPLHLLHGHRLSQAQGALRLVRPAARPGGPHPVPAGWPATRALLNMLDLLEDKADARGALHARVGLDGVGGVGVRPEKGALALADLAGLADHRAHGGDSEGKAHR